MINTPFLSSGPRSQAPSPEYIDMSQWTPTQIYFSPFLDLYSRRLTPWTATPQPLRPLAPRWVQAGQKRSISCLLSFPCSSWPLLCLSQLQLCDSSSHLALETVFPFLKFRLFRPRKCEGCPPRQVSGNTPSLVGFFKFRLYLHKQSFPCNVFTLTL